MPAREKILVAMSGGVDSSVAALLLKQQGCDLVGAYMKNWINEDNVIGECPWQQDIVDARAVADHLGIEFRVVNLMRDYRARVVDYLLDGYARGLTPNPDIMCNREIKFGVFRAWAKEQGFDAVATGHYARRLPPEDCGSRTAECGLRNSERTSLPVHGAMDVKSDPHSAVPNPQLLEGADKNKDQSYFLALLSQEQLRDARFPIGHLPKPELRAIARDAGLPTADKKDSQGICFIGEVKMADFLRTYVPDAPGPIVGASDGRRLGTHRGLHFYTLGQRRGIGVPSNTDHEAYVVVGKRAEDRALLVAFDRPDAPGLFQTAVRVHSLSWINEPVREARSLEGRVRYRDPRVPLRFIPDPTLNGCAEIEFATPQRGLASGQILALYDGERLLGGGVYA
ncbi:MnmA/TRMU family protein [Horticoccus sp. 23ND18S-11]|uniref:MnmA/TRMU family protein n=1 Tax=Horticoccus sp. 23ND18S-11 TaxID=3391832 RepID=UPI0039C9B0E5